MATNPSRIMNLTSSGIVPVERTRQTFGAGVPEAQKLAAERINSLPPPSFDVAVQHLASAAPMSAEGMQRLAVANAGATPAPVRGPTNGMETLANVGQKLAQFQAQPGERITSRITQMLPNLPPAAQAAVQAGLDRRLARRTANADMRLSRRDRIREILANRNQPGGLLGSVRPGPNSRGF